VPRKPTRNEHPPASAVHTAIFDSTDGARENADCRRRRFPSKQQVFRRFFRPTAEAHDGNRVLDWGLALGASAVHTATFDSKDGARENADCRRRRFQSKQQVFRRFFRPTAAAQVGSRALDWGWRWGR
jgi:hypothetical protein